MHVRIPYDENKSAKRQDHSQNLRKPNGFHLRDHLNGNDHSRKGEGNDRRERSGNVVKGHIKRSRHADVACARDHHGDRSAACKLEVYFPYQEVGPHDDRGIQEFVEQQCSSFNSHAECDERKRRNESIAYGSDRDTYDA